MAAEPILTARGVGKAFPGVRALDGVDFAVRPGEVVAVVGENGAGKSTLMKILAGLHRPDVGELRFAGQPLAMHGPADALRRGVALIHQELSLCDNLSVAGALFLGAERRRGPFLRTRAMAAETRRWLDRLGLDVSPAASVASLRLGQRQLLEIARALRAEARVLIMDEPTSSLTTAEVERLFAVVRELRAHGVAIVYISHRLAEVEQIADRVVGLRDGRNSGELVAGQINHERMVALMVGRSLEGVGRTPHERGEAVLAVQGVCTAAFPRAAIDFAVCAGEVVGIAGLLGSGRSELLRALFGVDARLQGEVVVAGAALPSKAPRAAVAAGLALVPEDRKHEGLVLGAPVRANLTLATLHRLGIWLDRRRERATAADAIAELGIACRDGEQDVALLSGGNQQKVVLGRWLLAEPKVLLLDEPTRGVDVGARAELYRRLDALAAAGMAIVFVSSDLEEVLMLADRVLVMHEGQIAGELSGAERSEERIMRLATGGGALEGQA